MKIEHKTETQKELEEFSSFKEAQAEYDEKRKRGRALIDDIGMGCSNDFVVIDSLMEVFQLFAFKGDGFAKGDLAEDLQSHLFTWTKEHGNAIDAWKDSVLYGSKYKTDDPGDDPGVKVEDDPTSIMTEGSKGEISQPAQTISALLNDEELPQPLKEAITDGLLDLFNTRINQDEFLDYEKSPEYVEKILRGYQAEN
jgi:hypothetical protein